MAGLANGTTPYDAYMNRLISAIVKHKVHDLAWRDILSCGNGGTKEGIIRSSSGNLISVDSDSIVTQRRTRGDCSLMRADKLGSACITCRQPWEPHRMRRHTKFTVDKT